MYIADLLADDHAIDNVFIRNTIADTHAGRQNLGVGTRINNTSLGFHRFDGRNRLTLIAQLKIRIVLENQNVVLLCKLQQLTAALQRHGTSGRVLEGRDNIDELNTLSGGKNLLQLVHTHAFVIHRNTLEVRAEAAERIECADKARPLTDNGVALVNHRLGKQADGLLAASRDNQLIVIRADIVFFPHALFRQVAQRLIAFGHAILQCCRSFICKNLRTNLRHFLFGQRRCIRLARRKCNDLRICEDLKNFTDCRRLHFRNMAGNFVFHNQSLLSYISSASFPLTENKTFLVDFITIQRFLQPHGWFSCEFFKNISWFSAHNAGKKQWVSRRHEPDVCDSDILPAS